MPKTNGSATLTDRPDVSGTPPEWGDFAEAVLTVCVQQFCQEGILQGMAFIGRADDEHIAVVPVGARSEERKNASADAIADVARQTQAGAIMCVLEAWTLRDEHMRNAQALIKRYGSLSAMPDTMKEEVLVASLETPNGMWVARASISRDDRTKGVEVGPFHFEFMPGTIGRFTHLLPASSSSTTLH